MTCGCAYGAGVPHDRGDRRRARANADRSQPRPEADARRGAGSHRRHGVLTAVTGGTITTGSHSEEPPPPDTESGLGRLDDSMAGAVAKAEARAHAQRLPGGEARAPLAGRD